MVTNLTLQFGPTVSLGEVAEESGSATEFRPSMTISHTLSLRGDMQYERSEFTLRVGAGVDDVYTKRVVGDGMPNQHATTNVQFKYLQGFAGTGVVLLADLHGRYRDLSAAQGHQHADSGKADQLSALIETIGSRDVGGSVGVGYRLSEHIMFSASAEATYDTEVPEAPLVGGTIAMRAETAKRRFNAGASIQGSINGDDRKKIQATRAALFVSLTEYFNSKRSGMTFDFLFTNKTLSLADAAVEGYRFAFGVAYNFRSAL